VAWKETRECRRAVRDALPFLQRAEEILIVGIAKANRKPPKDIFPMSRATFAAMELSWRAKYGGKRGGRSPPSSFTLFVMKAPI
jgi:hypothetical protein